MLLSQQILSTETLPAPSILAPAPWTLTGNGYIFLYRLPKKLIQENGFLADYQNVFYKGLVSSIMLVDYHTTPVGPYRELLFIPGLFKMVDKYTFSISKIYVSDQNSVWNGIENWGIPKEWADLTYSSLINALRKSPFPLKTNHFLKRQYDAALFRFLLQQPCFRFALPNNFGRIGY